MWHLQLMLWPANRVVRQSQGLTSHLQLLVPTNTCSAGQTTGCCLHSLQPPPSMTVSKQCPPQQVCGRLPGKCKTLLLAQRQHAGPVGLCVQHRLSRLGIAALPLPVQ